MLKCGLRTLNFMKEPNGLFKHFSSSFDTDLQFQFTKRNRMHRCGNAITRRSTPLCIDIKSSKYKYFSNTPNRTSETLPSEQNAAVGENTGVADNVNTNIELEQFNYQDYFGVQELFTVKDLFNARVHLGHTVRSLCPQMRPFIFGTRFDTCIFDLDETALLLRQALNFIAHIAHRGGIILFVARQPQIVHMVERTAIECGEYAQCRQWVTETFTAPRLKFGGEIRLPDLVILLHTKVGTQYGEHQAIIDSAKIGIPTIAIVDSDCNPNIITYPIPGNDDTLDSTQLYLHLMKQAILLGKKKRSEEMKN